MLHVLSAGSAQVGALQEQVRDPVQADAGGEGGDETIEAPQEDAEGPAQAQQNHQPYDAPETRPTTGHPSLGEGEEVERLVEEFHGISSVCLEDFFRIIKHNLFCMSFPFELTTQKQSVDWILHMIRVWKFSLRESLDVEEDSTF